MACTSGPNRVQRPVPHESLSCEDQNDLAPKAACLDETVHPDGLLSGMRRHRYRDAAGGDVQRQFPKSSPILVHWYQNGLLEPLGMIDRRR